MNVHTVAARNALPFAIGLGCALVFSRIPLVTIVIAAALAGALLGYVRVTQR